MIEGKKVNLDSVERSHLQQFRKWRNNPSLKRYFREYRLISATMQQEWYEKITSDQNQVNFSIKDKTSGTLIGHCGLYYIN